MLVAVSFVLALGGFGCLFASAYGWCPDWVWIMLFWGLGVLGLLQSLPLLRALVGWPSGLVCF